MQSNLKENADHCTFVRLNAIQENMRRKDELKLYSYLENADMPMLVFIGLGLGFLMSGGLFLTLFALIEAGEGEIWSLTALLSGLVAVCMSAVVGLVAALYWWTVPRRSGAMCPRLNGFGLILMALSCVGGTMASILLLM